MESLTVHPAHPHYLATAAGRTFIPLGLNLCFPRFATDAREGEARICGWIDALAAAGGNFTRFFLGHPFFDFEPGRAGEFSEDRAAQLRRLLDHAAARGVRLKLTLELFRTVQPRREAEDFPGAVPFERSAYRKSVGGPADDLQEFFASPEARRFFLRKLDWLAARFAGHPAVVAWELWNEINAVADPSASWKDWSAAMLPELKKRFPGTLALQSCGSLDSAQAVEDYRWLAGLPGNDLLQVHRYLDPGADMEICHGPLDVTLADSMRLLREFSPESPLLVAEGGAVESRHSGPSRLYASAEASAGILHDTLFAPFFAGSAGSGQAWHWDFCVERHGLWPQFTAFARAIAGFDPAAEHAQPVQARGDGWRAYGLRGERQSRVWVRAARPGGLASVALPVSAFSPRTTGEIHADTFDPWTGETTAPAALPAGETLKLAGAHQSLVVKLGSRTKL
jgi:hypothetical protein